MSIYITENGRSILEKKIAELLGELEMKRHEKNVAYTLSGDTWHDNPTFNSLEQEEGRIVRSISELKSLLQKAIVVTVKERDCLKVAIGSIVRCEQSGNHPAMNQESVWEIVGYGESDFEGNKISYDSPLGKSLMRMTLNETREAKLPAGLVRVTVTALYPSWDAVRSEG